MTDGPRLPADKFRDLARELGSDKDRAAIEEKARRVAIAHAVAPEYDGGDE